MNDSEAKAYLSDRYGSPIKETNKLSIFATKTGKELALANGTSSRATIYAEYIPEDMNLTLKLKIYSKEDSSRHSNLNATQTLGTGNAICKFTVYDTSELNNLCNFYEVKTPKLDFVAYVEELLKRAPEDVNKWIEGYKQTNQLAHRNIDDDETTYRLWKEKDNHVSSLQQGRPSNSEFTSLSQDFKKASQIILNSTSEVSYQQVIAQMEQFKESGKLKFIPWALVNRTFAAIAPELVTSTVNEQSFIKVAKYIAKRFNLSLKLNGSWFENNLEFKQALESIGSKEIDPIKVNSAIWIQFTELESKETQKSENQITEPEAKEYSVKSKSPLNQILYGPPGTGKTFHTIEAAVKAAEPELDFSIGSDGRKALKAKYDELVKEGRIRFVTFHQSYGYEEFVEGLRAKSDSGEISYEVEPGVFKTIVNDAQMSMTSSFSKLISDYIRVGDVYSSFKVERVTSELVFFRKRNGCELPMPRVVIDALGKMEGIENIDVDSLNAALLEELGTDIEPAFITGYKGLYRELIPALIDRSINMPNELDNYVLVIDEINRGNISKIFGELITLIEDSKRSGIANSESMKLTLPYSGDSFSVPDNLYIIGTMNTADRSLAMMDTALRRRFDFKEMMPDASLFEYITVKGVNLSQLLIKLNERIEALYDREHTLGHAFFFPVKDMLEQQGDQAAFEKLKSVFQNKILPLLEEYFFEDWHKIRLVLGDNQKSKTYQFVVETNISFSELFGTDNGLDEFDAENKQYKVASFNDADSVWNNPEAYIGIYTNQSSNELTE